MLRRSVGISAVCALGASALILPPGIANNGDHALAPSIVNPRQRLIQLPCPACAFSSKGENVEGEGDSEESVWIQGGANNIALNFTVSDDGERLELNGERIHPSRLSSKFHGLESPELYAIQVPASASEVEIALGQARTVPVEITGWQSMLKEETPIVGSKGDAILKFEFNILSLGPQPMDLDGVAIHLFRTADGELLILRLDSVPNRPFFSIPPPGPPPPTSGMPDMKECKMLPTSLCKLKNMLDSKVDAITHGRFGPGRPCPDFKDKPHHLPTHISPHLDFEAPPQYHHGRPHHERPYGHHHHRHHGHHGRPPIHSFARSIIAVLIPVMAGITVGLIVSLLGLLVGRLIGFFWTKLARGNSRGYATLPQNDLLAEEGKILLTHENIEPLPVYEDAPAYEEKETRPS